VEYAGVDFNAAISRSYDTPELVSSFAIQSVSSIFLAEYANSPLFTLVGTST
jgi:hypothetical protein